MEENLPWTANIKNTLERNGMLNFFINPFNDKLIFINKKIFQTLLDEFHQNSFASIKEEKCKLRTYALCLFKKKIGPEA